jgi:hypothetical protein
MAMGNRTLKLSGDDFSSENEQISVRQRVHEEICERDWERELDYYDGTRSKGGGGLEPAGGGASGGRWRPRRGREDSWGTARNGESE